MKNFLISFLFLFTVNLLFSQSLVVTGDSIVYGNSSDFQVESHLQVFNNSNNTAIVYCEKNVILQNQTGTNNFCWGGTCYGSSTIVSTKADTIFPGEKSDEFVGDYQPWNVPSIAKVEYCFYLDSDPADRTCFLVTYDATHVTDIEELIYSEEIGSFYPNPTNEYTNIFYNAKGMSVLQITDILGNVVKNIELEGSGEKIIYVGDLHKGIYFGNLVKNGEILKIKKLIINK
ncbi:MAG: T9SS type A sorting domain-containing protein [Flavobacteriales bacterium]